MPAQTAVSDQELQNMLLIVQGVIGDTELARMLGTTEQHLVELHHQPAMTPVQRERLECAYLLVKTLLGTNEEQLADARLAATRWLLTPHSELGERPVDAIRAGHCPALVRAYNA
ncbi:MAG TPA: hypothetical protein VFQ70_01125 [Candidatus Saccharimonadaceae bacterium]|nr:hypothetical protein [Candidatus Saccharimonadaceae bacterium]